MELKIKYLERHRIHRLLEKTVKNPIVSIIAGAGFGKTYAVYEFAKTSGIHTAWLQLSDRDNLGERFWENFVSAINNINTSIGEKLRKMEFPATEQQFNRMLEIIKRELIPNEKYLLVYDDLHLVYEPKVLRFLENSINNPFINITILLLSRTEPAVNLDKITSKKLLSRITENELRFTHEEMLSYFKLENINLIPHITSSIYKDTEGWAFAVHLAARSLKNTDIVAYVPQAIRSNTFRLIENEIIRYLSPSLRRFLIKLSLIENYSLKLIEEIAANTSLVKDMEGISSFIRFDSYLNSYHIHQLFLDYLKEKQDELTQEEKNDCWKRTALWCKANNRNIDAITYFEKIKDYENIIIIIDTYPLILPEELANFILALLDRAKEDFTEGNPRADVIRIRTLLSLGLFDENRSEIAKFLPRFKSMPETPAKHFYLLASYIILGIMDLIESIYRKEYNFISYFKKAAMEAKKSTYKIKAPLNGVVLNSYACRVIAPASMKDMEGYISIMKEIVPYSAAAMGGCRYGLYELNLGELSFFRGRIKDAENFLIQCIKKSGEKQQYETENRALFYMLRIHVSRGSTEETEKVLKQLENELEESLFPNRYAYYDIVMGWYYIQLGKREEAAAWLKNDYEESELHLEARVLEKLIKARYYYYGKRYPAALAVIQSRKNIEPVIMGEIEMGVLEAVCLYRMSNREAAFRTMENVYNLASPIDMVMPFIELGKDMRALTEAIIKEKGTLIPLDWLEDIRKRSMDYAKKIITLKKGELTGKNQKSILSHRELNVLTGLSRGLTRMEIAGTASISPNTVKSVIKSIYNKLGANNQADAVRIASEEGLI